MDRKAISVILVCIAIGTAATVTVTADMYVYPAKGQSQKQQSQDEYAYHDWAVKQSGVDPQKVAEEATSGDAGKGAAIGAAMGGALGHMRARRSVMEQQQAYDAAQAELKKELNEYDKAYSTRLEGRGYKVSQ